MSDLISREDAIKAVEQMLGDVSEEVVIKINCLTGYVPTAGRPHGEWIDQHEDGHGWWVGRCDQCGKENRVGNYCPNCGAKMKGGDSE